MDFSMKTIIFFCLIQRISQAIPLISSIGKELTTNDYNQTGGVLISSTFSGLAAPVDTDAVEVAAREVSPKDPNLFDLSVFGSELYRIPDTDKTGRLIDEYLPAKSAVNPEELGPYVEGDILMPQTTVILRNGLTSTSSRWPDGIVPFEIAGNFRRHELQVIANAIDEYHERTCIRFVTRTTETDYISLVNGRSGCWSSIGRVGGKQEVNLQTPGCLSKPGTPIHELMHVLGFFHEQNREERDSFVDIQYQNIKESAYENFKRVARTAAFGVPYDYGSVMHYSSKAFSQNGEQTIVAKKPEGNNVMGQRDGFSSLDVEKINRMYKCHENSKADEPPVDLTKAMATTFRPVRVIQDILGNIVSGLSSVG